MKIRPIIYSLLLASFMMLLPLSPLIQSHHIHTTSTNNPLFEKRISRFTTYSTPVYQINYFGQDTHLSLSTPRRCIITTDLITDLENHAKTLPTNNQAIQQKWSTILSLLPTFIDQLNTIYREYQSEIHNLLAVVKNKDIPELQQHLYQQIQEFPIDELQTIAISNQQNSQNMHQNITSGIICNITSGPICAITTQPICSITQQPLCALITKMPPCLTLMGLRCPTAGLKCNAPTTGTICDIWAKLGPILKSLLLIILISAIVFLPAIMLITILAPNICTNIQNRITAVFNCSTPQNH